MDFSLDNSPGKKLDSKEGAKEEILQKRRHSRPRTIAEAMKRMGLRTEEKEPGKEKYLGIASYPKTPSPPRFPDARSVKQIMDERLQDHFFRKMEVWKKEKKIYRTLQEKYDSNSHSIGNDDLGAREREMTESIKKGFLFPPQPTRHKWSPSRGCYPACEDF